jgi:predicted phosphodiesterase
MAIAALYDIHANLPALEAVIAELQKLDVRQVIVGGDVVPGPMPRETLERLETIGLPIQYLYGNGELSVLAQLAATDDPASVTYWGTRTGEALPEPGRAVVRWTAHQLSAAQTRHLSQWPKLLMVPVDGIGNVLFCHATPRSEVEVITRLTPDDRLLPILDGMDADLIVCGHTHMQFDRTLGHFRVVNAGSVGMPFQRPPGAYWLLIGQAVELRFTPYDLADAARRVRTTLYPQANEFAERHILDPPAEDDMATAMMAT